MTCPQLAQLTAHNRVVVAAGQCDTRAVVLPTAVGDTVRRAHPAPVAESPGSRQKAQMTRPEVRGSSDFALQEMGDLPRQGSAEALALQLQGRRWGC